MSSSLSFHVSAAHAYFSAECFNKAWELLDKKDRTPAEDEQLLYLAFASLWHWTQRSNCTLRNMSIGYWQIARVYAVLGQADNARQFGERCLLASQNEGAFFVGYAYESLARAEVLAGNLPRATEYLAQARKHAEQVSDAEDKKLLLNDLDALSRK